MAAVVKAAVDAGDYASTSEVVRDALRDWKTRRAIQRHEIAALKADIDQGLADVAAGRVKDFNKKEIIERGEEIISEPVTLGITETAEADLAEIWAYIAPEASEAIATRFVDTIKAQFFVLLRTPLMGTRREQFGAGLRVIFHGSYGGHLNKGIF